jgi:signal transduction histidine kinase
METARGHDLVLGCVGPVCRLAAGIEFETDIPNPLPSVHFPPEIRTELSLIVKKTLRNVVEHAGAKSVTLRLKLDESTLSLLVADDGRGFAVPADVRPANGPSKNGRGHGLLNLKARAQSIGGKLEITSRPGTGTTVSVVVPRSGK